MSNFTHKKYENFLPNQVAGVLKSLTNTLLTGHQDASTVWTSPDGIERTFLPPDVLSAFKNSNNSGKWHPWYTNFSWDEKLNEHKSSPKLVLCHNLKNTMPGRWCENEIIQAVEEKCPGYTPILCQIFVWTEGSYIFWHDDSARGRDGAVTIYLNQKWNQFDGGQLCYHPKNKPKTAENMVTVTPAWNTAVFLESGTMHRTTPVIGDKVRTSIQIWLKKKKKILG